MRTPAINPKIIAALPVMLSTGLVAFAVDYHGAWLSYLSPLILGVIAGGLADLDNGLTGRLKNILFTVIAFSISSLSVQITFNQPILLTSTFTALAFIFTIFGAAGNRYRTIAFATLVVAVYTCLSHQPNSSNYFNTLLLLCGTLLYSASSLLTHVLFPNRPVQDGMANAYQALSHYLNTKADFFDPDEADNLEQQQINLAMKNTQVINAFNTCRNALFYRMRGQHRHPRTTKMLRYYFIAQDIHERISSSHVHYQAFAEQMRHTDLIFRIQRLLRLQAQACADFSASLRQNNDHYQYAPKLQRATLGAEQSLQYYATHPQNSQIAPYRVQRLLDNIMHVSLQFSHLGKEQALAMNEKEIGLSSPDVRGFKGAWQALKAQTTLQSSVFRHAVRMAIIAFVCCLIVQFMPQLNAQFMPESAENIHLGFWVLLTAVFVCQPNYSATKTRLVQRILGTVAGVLVGSSLPLLSITDEIKLLIIVVMTTLFFLFRSNKHSYATFFITIQAIMGLSITGYDVTQFFVPRVIDTVVGALVSGAAVYLLWPDWKYLSLEQTGAQAIHSNGVYLRAIVNELQQYAPKNDLAYRAARRRSHDRAATLSSTLSDMSSEPKKYGDKLQDGFLLLKINYSLISYIAALGAYRDKIHCTDDNETEFLNRFFLVAQQVALLLEHMGIWNSEQFQTALIQLQNDIEQLRPNCDSDSQASESQNHMLWQQLVMISELLQPCYQALNRQHL